MADITIDTLQAENDALRADVHRLNSTIAIVRWKEEKARADQLKQKYQDSMVRLELLQSKHEAHKKQANMNLEANGRAYRAEKRLHILAEKSAELIEAMDKGIHQLGDMSEYATFVKKLLTSDIEVP